MALLNNTQFDREKVFPLLCRALKDKISHSTEYWNLPILHVFKLEHKTNVFHSTPESGWDSVDEILSPYSLGTCAVTGCHIMLVVMFEFPCIMLVDHVVGSAD